MKIKEEKKVRPTTIAYLALATGDGAALLAGGELRIDFANGRSMIALPQDLASRGIPDPLVSEVVAWLGERSLPAAGRLAAAG